MASIRKFIATFRRGSKMDWKWDSKSYKKINTKDTGIKKLDEGWSWQTVKLDSNTQGYGSYQVGVFLDDEANSCPYCKGTGERPKGSKCPVCKGKGIVFVQLPAVRCAYCRGTGEEKPRSNVTCTACKGKGIIHVDEPIEICSHCKGTGKEPTNKLVCIKCRGKGVVTVKRENKQKIYNAAEIEKISNFSPENYRDIKKERKIYSSTSGSEKEALEVIKKLGKSDRIAVAKNMSPSVSSTYAEYLCNALVKKRLLIRDGVFYDLTPNDE